MCGVDSLFIGTCVLSQVCIEQVSLGGVLHDCIGEQWYSSNEEISENLDKTE